MNRKQKILAALAAILCCVGIALGAAGAYIRQIKAVSISIIGGADGPTSIFLAGKAGNDFGSSLVVMAGVAVLGAVILGICIGRRKK